MLLSLFDGFVHTLTEVAIALAPLFIIVCFFQIFILHLPREKFADILKGFVLTFLGIALFLQGVYQGFIPIGQQIGIVLGGLSYNWILIPIGFILGFTAILAEPAVHVMIDQVDRVTSGSIPGSVILYCMAIGVALSVALAMSRIIYGIPLAYILIPGYILAFLMMRYTSERFISIAFDSGGVATGPMTVSFIMAMAIGVATAIEGRDPVLEGFGMISLVALAPILTILALGVIFRILSQINDDEEAET
ncbi:MAG TPA: DUF1538 domain-containing protein [Syntrophomonadaceae bacterium]|nr:DUF1538 domain-containing protein [Syntrophomonadaceae bacterium]